MMKERQSFFHLLACTVLCSALLPFPFNQIHGLDIDIDLKCEELEPEECAYAVSSFGARCVLERLAPNEAFAYANVNEGQLQALRSRCQTSSVMADKQVEWIETDECIRACGLQRMTYGLSTDVLLDDDASRMLCSGPCLQNCPNIVQLHLALAADEGLYLPDLCAALATSFESRNLVEAEKPRHHNVPDEEEWGFQRERRPGWGWNHAAPAAHPEGSPAPAPAPWPAAGWRPDHAAAPAPHWRPWEAAAAPQPAPAWNWRPRPPAPPPTNPAG